MKVELSDVRGKLSALIANSESREDVAAWAMAFVLNDTTLEFDPLSAQSKIWRAVRFLSGVDLRHGGPDSKYLHDVTQLQEIRAELDR